MSNRAQRRAQSKRRVDSISMLPTDITMRNELIDKLPAVVVQFIQPNVTFVQALRHQGWRQFIDDLEKVMESKAEEHHDEKETASGLTIPGTDDLKRLL